VWLLVVLIIGVALGRVQNKFRDDGKVDPFSRLIQSMVNGPSSALDRSLTNSSNFFGSIGDGARLREQNARLSEELNAMRLYGDRERAWIIERAELRKLAALPAIPGRTPLPAVVLNFQLRENRMTISVGSRDGVEPNMPVLAGGGLVGVIQTVSPTSSQMNLITSPQLRVGVRILREPPELGIIRGDGFTKLNVEYMSSNSRTEVGDRVVTSGFGERIPAGIPVGQIVSIQREQEFGSRRATVVPDVTVGAVREVVVLR
jgi:rod shape-determining protein MreC